MDNQHETKPKRQYRKNNIPNDGEYMSKYFLEYRDELYKRRKDRKWFCDACEKEYTSECRYLHLKSKKHLLNQELFNLKKINSIPNNVIHSEINNVNG
jgi:hypothetical protein